MTNSETFVKLYSTLETAIRKKWGYKEQAVQRAAERELLRYKEELNTLRKFRNVLAHSRPFGIDYCAEPHKKLIESLKRILEEVDDTLIIKHCIPIGKIEYASLNDSVVKYMTSMKEHVYTHIPILDEKGRVVGVFGESTLFSFILDAANKQDFQILDNELTFRDIEQYLKLEAHSTEGFCFVSKYTTVLDCRVEFEKMFESSKKRLGMIFVTENGKTTEGLLGIITAWGILGRNTDLINN